MKKPSRALVTILAIAAAAVQPLSAQGFKPFELGARAGGLGGAFAARADDASAVYFNPAGLAFQPGFRFKFEISYNALTTTAEIPSQADAPESRSARFMPQPYISLTIKDFVSLGIGVFSANVMKAFWPDIETGTSSSSMSSLNSTDIRSVLALRIFKPLALGVGVDFIRASQAWDHDETFTFGDASPPRFFPARIRTSVAGHGIGFTAGWLFKPSDRFGFGGKYTSRVDIDLKGTTLLDSAYAYQTPIQGLATKAKMAMPEELVVGLRVVPLKRLALHADFQKIGMSDAMDWAFDVDARVFADIERIVGYPPDAYGFSSPLALKDTRRLMFGIEYLLGDAFAVRAGYSRQESSVDRDSLRLVFPDLATEVFSLGAGYEGPFFDLADRDKTLGGLSADAFFQYGLSQSRKSQYPDFPALYKGNRWSVGVAVGFVF